MYIYIYIYRERETTRKGLLTILHNCCKQIHLDIHDQLFSHESECRRADASISELHKVRACDDGA